MRQIFALRWLALAVIVPGAAAVAFGQPAHAPPPMARFAVPRTEIFRGRPAEATCDTERLGIDCETVQVFVNSGPNFAGRYTLVELACGAGCEKVVIVDAQSGEVLDRVLPYPFFFDDPETNKTGFIYGVDSKLLIVRGCPEYRNCGTHYYDWTGSAFKVVYSLPMPPLRGSDSYRPPSQDPPYSTARRVPLPQNVRPGPSGRIPPPVSVTGQIVNPKGEPLKYWYLALISTKQTFPAVTRFQTGENGAFKTRVNRDKYRLVVDRVDLLNPVGVIDASSQDFIELGTIVVRLLDDPEIKPNDIGDYGCGPGMFLPIASVSPELKKILSIQPPPLPSQNGVR